MTTVEDAAPRPVSLVKIRPKRPDHWSRTLPPGTGRSVYAGVWLIPATVLLAVLVALLIRAGLASTAVGQIAPIDLALWSAYPEGTS